MKQNFEQTFDARLSVEDFLQPVKNIDFLIVKP